MYESNLEKRCLIQSPRFPLLLVARHLSQWDIFSLMRTSKQIRNLVSLRENGETRLVIPHLELDTLTAEVLLAKVSLNCVQHLLIRSPLAIREIELLLFNQEVPGLSGAFRCLDSLTIAGTRIRLVEMQNFIIPFLSWCPKLKQLNIERTQLSDTGFVSLINKLQTSHSLVTLCVRYNMLSNASMTAFVRNTSFLRMVNLKKNQISDEGCHQICKGLALPTSKIEVLNLGGQAPYLGDKSALSLAQMLKSNKSLRMLILKQNRITCAGVQAICAALKHNTYLKNLDLSHNLIRSCGLLAIVDLLRANPGISQICVHGNFIPPELKARFDPAHPDFGSLQQDNIPQRLSWTPTHEDSGRIGPLGHTLLGNLKNI